MPEYQYKDTPLSADRHVPQFRILCVLAGQGSEQIECNLLVRRFKPRPVLADAQQQISIHEETPIHEEIPSHEEIPIHEEYDALSYTWGPNGNDKIKIISNNYPYTFNVTKNLYAALTQLRRADEAVYLWVDAICINQSDKEEKNVQIPLMSHIYPQARMVKVWLGTENDHSDRAMTFIDKCLDLAEFDRLIDDSKSSDDWDALFALMRRGWWNRRWIIQEIALARAAEVWCGGQHRSWEEVATVISMLSRKPDKLRKIFRESKHHGHHPDRLGDLSELGAIRLAEVSDQLFHKTDQGQVTDRLFTFEALISSLSSFEASNPHDIVYAVLWIAKDASPYSQDAKNKHKHKGLSIDVEKSTVAHSLAIVQSPGVMTLDTSTVDGRYGTALKPTSPITTLAPPAPHKRRQATSAPEKSAEFRSASARHSMSQSLDAQDVGLGAIRLSEDTEAQQQNKSSIDAGNVPSVSVQRPEPHDIVPQQNSTEYAGSVVGSSDIEAFPDFSDSKEGPADKPDIAMHRRNSSYHSELAGAEGLRSHRPSNAVDRQKVDATLRMAAELIMEWIEKRRFYVDYKQSVFETCLECLRFVFERTNSLDMLCRPWAPTDEMVHKLAELERKEDGSSPNYMPNSGNEVAKLPSWMAQVSRSAFAPTSDGTHRRINADALVGKPGHPAFGRRLYEASGKSRAYWKFHEDNHRILSVKGYVVDTVKDKRAAAQSGTIPAGWLEEAIWADSHGNVNDYFWRTLVAGSDSSGRQAPRQWQHVCKQAFHRRPRGSELITKEILYDCPEAMEEFLERVQNVIWGRRLIFLEQRRTTPIALGPANIKRGDLICILYGCSVPVILREMVANEPAARRRRACWHPECPNGPSGSTSSKRPAKASGDVYYEFIGECYVHGSMNGEAKMSGDPQWFDLR